MKNNLKTEIQKYYSAFMPTPDKNTIEHAVCQARTKVFEIYYAEDTTTFLSFFLSQIAFIRKKVWLIQFVIFLSFSFLIIGKQEAASVLGAMTTLIPLILMTWTRELSRAFVYETVEVELSTHFTLRQAVLSRITIMGLVDLLALTVFGFGIAHEFSLEAPNVFMFLFVPFLITAFGCLFILNHLPAKCDSSCCATWCGAVMTAAFYLANWEAEIYDAAMVIGWYIAFIIALTLAAIEFHLLLKKCAKDVCYRQTA